MRYLWWQISSRLWEPEQVKPWIGELKLVVKRGYHASTACHYLGLPEFESMAFLLHLLRPGDLFVDAGANIGAYSLLASGICKARSLAFEPDQATSSLLLKNVGLNRLDTLIELHSVALGSACQHAQLTNNKGIQNHISTLDSKNGAAIEIKPLDYFATNQTPLLIKIDVEGYETEVIRGATNTLEQPEVKALIVERMGLGNRFGFNEDTLHGHLVSLGFQAYGYQPFERKLTPLDAPIFGNNLYLKDVGFIENRLMTASKFCYRGTSF